MLRTLFACALACACYPSTSSAGEGPDARFDKLVDAYYAEFPAAHPSDATGMGLHDRDADLEDLSEAGVAREVKRLQGWRARFGAFAATGLSQARAADLALLESSIDAALLEALEVQAWRHRPDTYPDLASRSIDVIIKRDFAPAAERLRSVIARERKIPALLAQGRHNLRGVARIAVQITLDQLGGIVEFFRRDVPLAFNTIEDRQLKKQLDASTHGVIAALVDYRTFLEKELLPKATAGFAIGEALFRKKLKFEEMIDTPIDPLLARGQAELERLQAEFRATAAKIDPKRPATEVQADLQKDHDPADQLISGTQARLAGLRKFLIDKHIVTVPSEVMPKVEETPAFMRATTFASMETPGPFETKAAEAFYNVTLPEKSWTPEQVEDFLRGAFSRTLIDVVSIHEAFPGHYVQFLWLPRIASKVRKFEGANTNSEGWAHYCEQMMLDEGYGGGDPKLRLAQLQDALLRAARYVVGIRMHTRGMTFDQAVEFFQKEGMQAAPVAKMEVRRGTGNPTYLYYTLGKLEILNLRDDYRRKLGPAYTLQKFHDALLAQGALPLPLVRQALLGTP